MIILIPAYKPDQSLVRLARALREQDATAEIFVIDDGSGSTYAPIFTELRLDGVTVRTHSTNRGKGAALRTGIEWARANRPGEVVVTADADGQHLPRDIFRVGARAESAAASGQRSSSWAYAPYRIRMRARKVPKCPCAHKSAIAQPLASLPSQPEPA